MPCSTARMIQTRSASGGWRRISNRAISWSVFSATDAIPTSCLSTARLLLLGCVPAGRQAEHQFSTHCFVFREPPLVVRARGDEVAVACQLAAAHNRLERPPT